MLYLIQNAECFAPNYIGKQDVLIGGSKILKISPSIKLNGDVPIHVVNASGKWLIPGLVDSLVHITGGGGEAGFSSRTPEIQLSDIYHAGITTMVGALGTDSVTRSLGNLIAKARELRNGGISCYCHTGSYHIPVKTLTGKVESDIIYIPEIIGVGEIAISDHRSSQPTIEQLSAVASEARVAGLISGKAGIVSIHVGDGEGGLKPLNELAERTDLPLSQFYPTHINRNVQLLEQGISYTKQGGYIDFTTSTTPEILASGEMKCSSGLAALLHEGVSIENISFSSDGNASLPLFDQDGNIKGLQVGQVSSLWQAVKDCIEYEKIDPAQAIQVVTSNPAGILRLNKGTIAEGRDADLNLIDADTLKIESVMAMGEWCKLNNQLLKKGPFE